MITIDIRKSQKTTENYALFLSFPYDTFVVNTIKGFPSRYWMPESKEWELPFKRLGDVLNAFSQYEIEIKAPSISFFLDEKPTQTNYLFKTTPYGYQMDGFNYGMEHDRWLLGDEQGLGKTKQVIDIACAKKQTKGYKHCLIICGINGLKWNWVNEVHTHSNEDAWILGQKNKKGKITIGSNTDKYNDLCDLYQNEGEIANHYFIITNVESLRDEQICGAIKECCQEDMIGMIAADEIHKCFDYNTHITTNKGDLKIGDVVTKQLNVDILSYNEETKQVEYKPIKNWFENPIVKPLMELEIMLTNGEHKVIKCTDDHKFFTNNRGWVEAKDLTDEDDIVELPSM